MSENSNVQVDGNQCQSCRHFWGAGCPAFPQDVPVEILTTEVTHDTVLPGQVGDAVFEAGLPEADASKLLQKPV